jgi:hypothetical protein
MIMVQIRRSFSLNRAVLSQRTLDSRALTVLASLFHRFTEAGNYEAFFRQGDRLIQRATRCRRKRPQITIDLATLKAGELRPETIRTPVEGAGLSASTVPPLTLSPSPTGAANRQGGKIC